MINNSIKVLITAVLLSSINSYCLAEINNPADYNPYFKTGNCTIENGSFNTGNDGQIYISKQDDFELRLKQNSSISISNNQLALTDELSLDQGIIGLKVASDTLLVKTPFADIKMRNATVTIKVSKYMTRLCVLKGTAVLKQNTNIISLKATNEIAAAKNRVSLPYKFLDDLRYVWYWTTPDKEPSLLK